jgi:O-succinylbenzoic acid--CoA ligase
MSETGIDLEFGRNQLLLNPRLPEPARTRFEKAWRTLVEPHTTRHVGIATSGSSGDSLGKIILLSKDALEASARAVNERFESDARDVWFKSLPSFHVGGLGILVRARQSGASVYEDRSEKWSAHDFIDQVRSSRATLISLVPTQVFDLVQAHIAAPSHVRAVIVGGGRFEESLRLKALDLGWPCLPSYGMTETCSQIATALSPEDPRLTLLSHADARVSSDGRLAVKAASLLSAQITFKPDAQLIDPKVDGWLLTEDRARVHGGVLTIEGRTHDFVKIGGEGVSVARLDETLERLKLASMFAADAALLAAHDDRLGATMVLLTTASGPESASLVERFNAAVAPFERIRVVKHVGAIPRSPLGKLLRAAALELVGLRPAQP